MRTSRKLRQRYAPNATQRSRSQCSAYDAQASPAWITGARRASLRWGFRNWGDPKIVQQASGYAKPAGLRRRMQRAAGGTQRSGCKGQRCGTGDAGPNEDLHSMAEWSSQSGRSPPIPEQWTATEPDVKPAVARCANTTTGLRLWLTHYHISGI